MRNLLPFFPRPLTYGCLLMVSSALPLSAVATSIGSTGTLDRAKKLQDRVAVPGHDDSQSWTSSVDLGASLTRGNSNTLYVTASITVDRDFGKNELFANLTYAYGEESDNVTEDEYLLTASLSRLITEDKKWYFGGRIDGQHDELAEIDYRFTFSSYFGHYFVKRPDDSLQLSAEAGLGATTEDQGGEQDSFAIFYAGHRLNYWITDFTRLYEGVAFFLDLSESSSFQILAEAGIETFLSDSLSFKAYAQNKYESEPAAQSKSNDLRLVTGISYKF